MHIALLQIRTTPLGPELPGPATLLFTHPIRGIMPKLTGPVISPNNYDEHYETLVKRQTKRIRTMIYQEIMFHFVMVYCSGSMSRWWTMDPWCYSHMSSIVHLQTSTPHFV